MSKKNPGNEMKTMGFHIDAATREDFILLARIMPGNLSPAAYIRKLIKDEIEAHQDLLAKAKELRNSMTEGDSTNE